MLAQLFSWHCFEDATLADINSLLSNMTGPWLEPQQKSCLLHLLLLLLSALLVHQAAAQQADSVISVQLLPSAITLVADWLDDDPTAVCSTSNVVSASVDALLGMQQPGAPRTLVLSLALSSSQLLEATIFSTAGLQVVLFQQSGETPFESALHCCRRSYVVILLVLSVAAGWVAVYSSAGWARYRISIMQNPLVLSLAITGQQYRLCINLACALPAQVSSHPFSNCCQVQPPAWNVCICRRYICEHICSSTNTELQCINTIYFVLCRQAESR